MRVALITAPIGALLAVIALLEILSGDIWLGSITIAASLFAILAPVLLPAPTPDVSTGPAPLPVTNPADDVEAVVRQPSAR